MGKDSFDSASYSAEYGDTSTNVTRMGGKSKSKRKNRRYTIRKRSLEKAGQRISSRAGGKSRKTRRR